jgi:Tol biopolymer transport system component
VTSPFRSRSALLAAIAAAGVGVIAPPAALATFPGDNGKIVFTRDGDIWTVSSDGTGERPLTSGSDHYDTSPNWSPDGSELLFERSGPAGQHIYRMRADGSGLAWVREGSSPQHSHDGRRIAFNFGELYTSDRDGKNPKQIAQVDTYPTDWSPINDLILYNGGTGFSFVATVSPHGNELRIANPHDHEDLLSFSGGSWAPDGTRFAFSGERDGESPCFGDPTCPPNPHAGVIVMGLDGKRAVLQPTGRGPVFSPDGRLIAFEQDGQLRVMGVDGKGLRTLVAGGGADWQPLARATPPPPDPPATQTATVTVPAPPPPPVIVEKVVTKTVHVAGEKCVIPPGKKLTFRIRATKGIRAGTTFNVTVDLRGARPRVKAPRAVRVRSIR